MKKKSQHNSQFEPTDRIEITIKN